MLLCCLANIFKQLVIPAILLHLPAKDCLLSLGSLEQKFCAYPIFRNIDQQLVLIAATFVLKAWSRVWWTHRACMSLLQEETGAMCSICRKNIPQFQLFLLSKHCHPHGMKRAGEICNAHLLCHLPETGIYQHRFCSMQKDTSLAHIWRVHKSKKKKKSARWRCGGEKVAGPRENKKEVTKPAAL